MATATPVPTRARCSGASSTSSATARSAPASPGRAYRGAVASGELRRTGTSTSGREGSSTPPTLAAPLPAGAEVGQHPAGQVLGGPAVAPTGHGGAQQERRGDRDAAGQPAAHPPAQRAQSGRGEGREHHGPARPVHRALLRPAGQVGGGGRRPAGGPVQLTEQRGPDRGGEHRLLAALERAGGEGGGRGHTHRPHSPPRRRDGCGSPRR